MKLLILGGTRFLGRHLVAAAEQAGHEVTLFNRGISNPGVYPNLEAINGNRETDLDRLDGRIWDVVIDTCGFLPRIVGLSARHLVDQTARYIFISTISVYADFSNHGITESAPLVELVNPAVEEITGETYGGLKVLCEQAADDAMPGRVLHVRPGLIVGPYDPTDRFTYWPWRVAKGGRMIAPMPGDFPVQLIDGRDLARWTISMAERQETGIYNATGPATSLTFNKFLVSCQSVFPGSTEVVWIPAEFLLSKNIQPWSQIPMWIPGDEYAGTSRVNITKALQAGLTFMPLEQTVWDTLEWAQARGGSYELRAGLSTAAEKELVDAWEEQTRG